MMKTEKIGLMAANEARKVLLSECSKTGLTVHKTLKTISEGLEAMHQVVSYDKEQKEFAYSDPMIDHGARFNFARLAVTVLDLKPPERMDVNVSPDLPNRLREARERAARLPQLLELARQGEEVENAEIPEATGCVEGED